MTKPQPAQQAERGRITAETLATEFGEMVRVECPPDYDLIVVSINRGYGLEPKMVLLPHQLYTTTIERLLRENPGCRWITVTPARSDLHQDVWSEWSEP